MADYWKTAGMVFFIGLFLSPIITSLMNKLVNKLFAYLVFDASRKLKELEHVTIREVKKMLSHVEEQTVLRAADDKGSEDDLKILYSVKMDLKSALYEAEDILDLIDYRRIKKDLDHGDGSTWVQSLLVLGAACSRIASWFGRSIDVTRAAVMESTQSLTWLGQFIIQGMQNMFVDFKEITRTAVLPCLQRWYQQLGQIVRRVTPNRSGVLPVSDPLPQPPCPASIGSVFGAADPKSRPAEQVVDEKETVDATQKDGGEVEIKDGEGRAMPEEIMVQGREKGQEGEIEEDIEEHDVGGEEGKPASSEETEEENAVQGKAGEPTSLSILLGYCARSMLSWHAAACFYRDWQYEIVGIRSNKVPYLTVILCLDAGIAILAPVFAFRSS